jgi:hypothetical protein
LLNSLLGTLSSGVAASTSSYESIASATGSGSTSVTFSSIPSTYKHLQIRFALQTAAAGYGLNIQFNGDTGANYARHRLYCNGTTVTANGASSATQAWLGDFGLSSRINEPMVGIIDITDYASTTKTKTLRAITAVDANGSGGLSLISDLWTSTSAIDSVYLFIGSTLASTSTFALYGIKG